MMRLHKVYHRISLLSVSATSPLTPITPSFLSLSPPSILRLRPNNAVRSVKTIAMTASRFRYLVPINAVAGEDGGGGPNGSVSSSATATPPTDNEGNFKIQKYSYLCFQKVFSKMLFYSIEEVELQY